MPLHYPHLATQTEPAAHAHDRPPLSGGGVAGSEQRFLSVRRWTASGLDVPATAACSQPPLDAPSRRINCRVPRVAFDPGTGRAEGKPSAARDAFKGTAATECRVYRRPAGTSLIRPLVIANSDGRTWRAPLLRCGGRSDAMVSPARALLSWVRARLQPRAVASPHRASRERAQEPPTIMNFNAFPGIAATEPVGGDTACRVL
ncbi:uncharacterized protein LOC126146468 [Schistocerca cancellata]|uniref:uncharacterized protein LOC126146468 n=1 Tax=Schistocerca cancellata TaxID=274614 RepID=UPI00211892F2|nr:uncharacterized protein LOC126146468 [Schistocerca cancellata]